MTIPRAARLLLDLVLLSVVLAISISSGAAAAAQPVPVYDTDGHEVSADADYYVLPAPGGSGGGLTLAPISGLRPCPLYVAHETDDPLRKGLPVRFTPLQQQDRTVRVSSDVGVDFGAMTTCVQTTEWHVSGAGAGRRLVLTGPDESPSPNGRDKVFRVETHGRGRVYKLVWCGAGGSSTSSSSCQDLGVFRDKGDRRAWLGTIGGAHAVVFERAAATVHA